MTITPEEFLKNEIDWGISAANPQFMMLCQNTVNHAKAAGIEFETVLDYGAGTGCYAECFRRAGYDVTAVDIWDSHRNYMRNTFPDLNVSETPVTTDLMLFIEVAEHMTDDEIRHLFSQISPKYILFSSTPNHTTPEFDTMWGHINIKQEPEWVALFSELGYKPIKKLSVPTSWALMLEKDGATKPKKV